MLLPTSMLPSSLYYCVLWFEDIGRDGTEGELPDLSAAGIT